MANESKESLLRSRAIRAWLGALIFASGLLAGCFPYEHARYDCDTTFQASYGAPVDSVITQYGPPSAVRVDERGGREYHWDRVRVVAHDGHGYHAHGVQVTAASDGRVSRHEIREVRR